MDRNLKGKTYSPLFSDMQCEQSSPAALDSALNCECMTKSHQNTNNRQQSELNKAICYCI